MSCTFAPHCTSVWCSRLCNTRSQAAHPFLCHVQNPAIIPLWKKARSEEWIALASWIRIAAVLFGEWTKEGKDMESLKEWKLVQGLAVMSLRERTKIFSGL